MEDGQSDTEGVVVIRAELYNSQTLSDPVGLPAQQNLIQNHSDPDREQREEPGLRQQNSLNNNGEEEEEGYGRMRGERKEEKEEEEEEDQVMVEEEEEERSETSSSECQCQSPDTPMTDSSFSDTGSLVSLETTYPISPVATTEELVRRESEVELHTSIGLAISSVGPTSAPGLNTSMTRPSTSTTGLTSSSTTGLTSSTTGLTTSTTEPTTCIIGPSSIVGPTSIAELTDFTTGPHTCTPEPTSAPGPTSAPEPTSAPGPTLSPALLASLKELGKTGDDGHLPQHLHQIAEAFVQQGDYQGAVRCVQLERLYHQRLLHNLATLQEDWERRCGSSSSTGQDTQPLESLVHICSTHQRPRSRTLKTAAGDSSLRVGVCGSDGLERLPSSCSSGEEPGRSSKEGAEGFRDTQWSRGDGMDRGTDRTIEEGNEMDRTIEQGSRTDCTIEEGSGTRDPTSQEDMSQTKDERLEKREEEEKKEEEEVEQSEEAVEVDGEQIVNEVQEELHEEPHLPEDLHPEALHQEAHLHPETQHVTDLHQEAHLQQGSQLHLETHTPQEAQLHPETQHVTDLHQEAQRSNQELCQVSFGLEGVETLRSGAASLDEMAKRITVEESTPTPGLVSILKRRSVSVEGVCVSTRAPPPEQKPSAKRRVRFKVPDDGLDNEVAGGDSCLLLFLLCLVTVVISLGGTALYCALGDAQSSVCKDFSRNADFYLAQVQRGVDQLEHWLTPGS